MGINQVLEGIWHEDRQKYVHIQHCTTPSKTACSAVQYSVYIPSNDASKFCIDVDSSTEDTVIPENLSLMPLERKQYQ